ncbi:MAG TPA: UbiA family prenyltransferase [Egibacteraceae bacterium]|nr:UbiA family prenyltransferase [Egibacteraceae bacterium]
MKTVVALLRCSHFAPTVAVTAFATLLAWRVGRGAEAVWVAAAVFAGQLSVGWSNDWLDRERDRTAARTDKPLVRGDVPDALVGRGAVVAVVAAVALSLLSGLAATGVHAVALAMAWSYNLVLKRTVASPLPYAIAFALLPPFVTLGLQPPVWPPAWAVAAGALLGAGAHFANTLPDLAVDERTGVRGLPHRLGARGSTALATALLGMGVAVVAVGAGTLTRAATVTVAASAAVVLAVPLAWAGGRQRRAFQLAMAAAGGVVATLVVSGSRLV